MLPVEMLATSARPLADVLIDRLRAAGGPSALEQLRPHVGDEADALFVQADLPLEDEEDFVLPVRPLRPDEVAAAVLLGRALDRNRHVLGLLQDPATIAIIEVSREDLVEPVERIFRHFVVGGDLHVIDGDRCKPGDEIAPAGSVVLFSGDDDSGKKARDQGNAAFGAAVQRRCAIVGMAADPGRMLPPDLVRLADHRIVLPPLGRRGARRGDRGHHRQQAGGRRTRSWPARLRSARSYGLRARRSRRRGFARCGSSGCFSRDPSSTPEPTLADLHGLGAARAWGESPRRRLARLQGGAPALVGCRSRIASSPARRAQARPRSLRALAQARPTCILSRRAIQRLAGRAATGHLGNVTKAIRRLRRGADAIPAILFIDEIDTLPARGSTMLATTTGGRAIVNCTS